MVNLVTQVTGPNGVERPGELFPGLDDVPVKRKPWQLLPGAATMDRLAVGTMAPGAHHPVPMVHRVTPVLVGKG